MYGPALQALWQSEQQDRPGYDSRVCAGALVFCTRHKTVMLYRLGDL